MSGRVAARPLRHERGRRRNPRAQCRVSGRAAPAHRNQAVMLAARRKSRILIGRERRTRHNLDVWATIDVSGNVVSPREPPPTGRGWQTQHAAQRRWAYDLTVRLCSYLRPLQAVEKSKHEDTLIEMLNVLVSFREQAVGACVVRGHVQSFFAIRGQRQLEEWVSFLSASPAKTARRRLSSRF